MRALKALVIFMGVIIVLGVAVIAVTIFNRLQTVTAAYQEFAIEIAAPDGNLVEMTAGGGRIVLRYEMADGSERLVVIDSATGRRLGTVDLLRAP